MAAKKETYLIEGARIALRGLRTGDLKSVTRWINEPDTAYYMGVATPVTTASQKKWFDAMQSDESKRVFAVVLRRTGRHIGNIGLSNISGRDRNAMLNIFIGGAADRGKGYAREALLLALYYCFNSLGLNRVWLILHADNKAALRLYESVGMRREGVLRKHEQYGGKYVDKIVMGILKSDFEEVMKPDATARPAGVK